MTPTSIFSDDPYARAVEVAFIRRVFSSLERPKSIVSFFQSDMERNLERFGHALFEELARALESDVPEDAKFGRFHDSPDGG